MPPYDSGNDPVEWVKGLATHRAGRLLSNHLACVEVQTRRSSADCAFTEALNNERVFIHSLARSLSHDTLLPCGLPSPLPRFIAILNLSGERMLAYSDNASLIRCLCTQSRLRGHDLDQAIDAFAYFPLERSCMSARFVVLVYSMPWQAGTGGAFWHLSACELGVTEDGSDRTLRDRMLQFSSVAPSPFQGKSVRDASDHHIAVRGTDKPMLPVVGTKQIADFAESYSAVGLDLMAPVADAKPQAQDERLLELVQVLKRERQSDHKELKYTRQQLKTLEATMETALRTCESNAKDAKVDHERAMDTAVKTKEDMLGVSRQQNDALAAEVLVMRESARKASGETQKSIKDHKKLVEKFREMQRQTEAKDTLNNAARFKHVGTISRLEGLVASSDERLAATTSELECAHVAATAKLVHKHEEETERLTSTLESKKRIINQLSENNDRKDVENASLKTHTDEQTIRIKDLEGELKKRSEECTRLEEELKKRPQEAPPPPPPRTRSKAVGTHTRNASTATHHCASTQTAIWKETNTQGPVPALALAPAPAPAPTVGMQVVPEAQAAMPCSYQAAIDMLQGLVTFTTPTQHVAPVHPAPNPYNRPLPYPHFNPIATYHPHHQPHPHPHHHPHHPQQHPHVNPKAYLHPQY